MNIDFCINVKAPPAPLTREGFERVIADPRVMEICNAVARGETDLKRQLPGVCWQASFHGKARKNRNAVPNGLFALDVDHVENPEETFLSFRHRISELGIFVVHKTPSAHGLRIVAACHEGFATIGENQAWLAKEIGVVHDAVARDFSRAFFLAPKEYFYFYDPNIFCYDPPFTILNTDTTDAGETKACSMSLLPPEVAVYEDMGGKDNMDIPPDAPAATGTFCGVSYDDIVRELVTLTGGEPKEGERNNRLFQICCLLTNITDRRKELMFSVCPRFGLSEKEVWSCCTSACKMERSKAMPHILRKALRNLGIEPNAVRRRDMAESDEDDEEYTMPVLPKQLPPIFKEFADTAPEDFKAATVMACLPVVGFLGSRLRSSYIDGEMQAPSFIVNIIAPAASGKGSLLRVTDFCLEKVREKDEEGRQEEREYRKEVKATGKAKSPEPTPSIRDIPVKISIAQLLRRMRNARGLHLFSVSPEVDTLTNSNHAGAWSQKSDILRLSQDADGGRYGQDYYTDNSISETCKIRYNLLNLGTPMAFERAFPDVEDGLVSRCVMVELPDQFGKPMPKRKELSEMQKKVVKENIERLMALCEDNDGNVMPEHFIDLTWLNKRLEAWIKVQRDSSVKQLDHARDQFMRRAALMGFRAGMLAAFLWDVSKKSRRKHTECFACWVADYMLATLLMRYSAQVNDNAQKSRKKPRFHSLWDDVPETFTIEDLKKAMLSHGIRSTVKNILYLWRCNGLIETQDGRTFSKKT